MPEYRSFTPLQQGDHICILCTARIGSSEKLQPAIAWLENLGYHVSLGNTVDKQHHQYGGTTEERLADFHKALENPSINAIWIARGGYGSIKIVDLVDLNLMKGNKLLMGYSDVTNIHGLWQRHGLQSLHCFMPQELPEKSVEVREQWNQLVTGKGHSLKLENVDRLKQQVVTAPLVGGNLSVLVSMLGSATFPDVDGHILFIEDLDEYLYHIDRLMTTLRRSRKLDHLKALLVGGMTDLRDHEIPFGKTAKEIIIEHTEGFDYPVIFDFPAGHVTDNYSFALGRKTTITISDSISITQ